MQVDENEVVIRYIRRFNHGYWDNSTISFSEVDHIFDSTTSFSEAYHIFDSTTTSFSEVVTNALNQVPSDSQIQYLDASRQVHPLVECLEGDESVNNVIFRCVLYINSCNNITNKVPNKEPNNVANSKTNQNAN